jgi:hypothetical protein
VTNDCLCTSSTEPGALFFSLFICVGWRLAVRVGTRAANRRFEAHAVIQFHPFNRSSTSSFTGLLTLLVDAVEMSTFFGDQ